MLHGLIRRVSRNVTLFFSKSAALLFFCFSVIPLSQAQVTDAVAGNEQEETSELRAKEPNADEFSAEELVGELAERMAEQQAAEQARALEVAQELQTRQQAIEEMQSEQGIYSPALQEAYSDLARFFEEIDDHESALSTLENALQVTRINTGLYSEQQLPLIGQMIGSNTSLTEWQSVDDLHELALLINSRIYELDSSEYMDAAEGYGNWKLRMLRENLLELNSRGLNQTARNLSEYYDSLIERVENQQGGASEDLLQILYGKTEIDLALANYIARIPYTAFESSVPAYINQTRCQNVRNSAGAIVRQCYNVRVENPRYRQSQKDAKRFQLNRHSRSIQESLQRMEQIAQQSTTLSAAEKDDLYVQIGNYQGRVQQTVRRGRRGSLL